MSPEVKKRSGRKSQSKEFIKAKKITIETGEEKIIYDISNIENVFKIRPAGRGRLHLGTNNKVVVIELKDVTF